ncbi:MAG: aminopeptidase P family protein [Defluviitaleaceae bacterium]|nr:aminopeptidase P family protein [Defluviitaleaceae bacterium]
MKSKMFKEHRTNFAKELPSNSLYIAFAGNAVLRTADQHYPFTPNRNFFYLTGLENPAIILLIDKNAQGEATETLYLEAYDELVAKWDGAVLNEERAKELSGVEKFRPLDRFERDMAMKFHNTDGLTLWMDFENRYFNPGPQNAAAFKFAKKVKENYPYIALHSAFPTLARLRTIKSKSEVKLMKEAIKITGKGIENIMKNSKPGMMEYEFTAHFDFQLRVNGVKEHAFNTIAASGKNATILHYGENNCKTQNGDLILFDLGAQYGYYAADISRTFPVNGKFTDRQKELYNIVLGAQEKVFALMKHGTKYSALNAAVIDHYVKELSRIGLIKEKDETKARAEVAKYYYHGVSHHLGLDVHDVARMKDGELKKGMVFTVEPGLYIAEENIGIRIEDNVLIKEDGCEILSDMIPKTVEEIEAIMAGKAISKKK